MSTDHELLEAAARAAGLTGFTFINGNGAVYLPQPGIMQPYQRWNPLADDGDAARLATRLRIDILHGNDNVTASTGAGYVAVPYGDDADAATRRAVTTLAAQIGKTNQPGEAG